MKKEEFIAALAAEIRDLSREDIARSLEYYGEMIDERTESGMSVEEAVNDLGGVEAVAKQILEELPRERKASQGKMPWNDGNWPLGENAGSKIDELGREMGALGEKIGKEMGALGEQISREVNERYAQYEDEEPDGGEHEYTISEEISAVDARMLGADVRVMRSDDGETHVITENACETVEVRDGVLHITQNAEGRRRSGSRTFLGFHINFNFSFDSGSLTLRLADKMWESIVIRTANGDVEAEDIRARGLELATKSGDIDARHLTVEGLLKAETTSGDVEAENLTAGELVLISTSGDVDVDETETGSMRISTRSGDLKLENTLVHGELKAETTNGDVSIRRSDGRDVFLSTTNGDIEGTLLSPKEFFAHSTSGDVRLPQSEPGAGRCEARTTSGDVSLRIAP
ncbi:MAG: DUF4097 family beta strand repeat protein [Oscillospiraceae bacterium]|nr:DUF4097 family beta strand repeat protein [Oscillospiraceae bacterium]